MNFKAKRLSYALMLLTVGLSGAFVTSCNDDEKPKVLPTVSTTSVTDIELTSAKIAGEIEKSGNDKITASGFVYSNVIENPTISEEKVEGTVTKGSFTLDLVNLSSGTTYYVRAYATNSVGTGYGDAIEFMTGNAPPVATMVAISGVAKVGQTLTATYNYSDAENDQEEGSTFQWYVANDGAGAGEVAIDGATGLTYVIQDGKEGKYVRFGVTPKSATGSTVGLEVKSGFTAGIGEETEVKFTYNNQEVTYGIIVSSVTGKKWLDRNLGAANAPSASNDWENYGDVFQWGRGADGHQLTTRTGPSITVDPRNPVGADAIGESLNPAYSTTDNPGHGFFIIMAQDEFNVPHDWRKPYNNNLWQAPTRINNPCPLGWHIPTKTEWEAEGITNASVGYSQLKLTLTSYRRLDAPQSWTGSTRGYYWTSTPELSGPDIYYAYRFIMASSTGTFELLPKANGNACKCIKD